MGSLFGFGMSEETCLLLGRWPKKPGQLVLLLCFFDIAGLQAHPHLTTESLLVNRMIEA